MFLCLQVNLATGEGLEDCLAAVPTTGLDVVINCVAISQPAVCEKDPELAKSLNIPSVLLSGLENYANRSSHFPLVIHLSTDQVYDGSRSFWKESDPTDPINEYGKSKLAAEQEIQARWPNYIILRSSIIYGPQPPGASVGRALFLQFVDEALASGQPTTFFNDEWRCPVYVEDIVRISKALSESFIAEKEKGAEVGLTKGGGDFVSRVYNMGGPERMSRVDMAEAVASVRNYDTKAIVSASSTTIQRGVASPPDISMVSTALEERVGFKLSRFGDALIKIFEM